MKNERKIVSKESNGVNYIALVSLFTIYVLFLIFAIIFKIGVPRYVMTGQIALEQGITITTRITSGILNPVDMPLKQLLRDIILNIAIFIPLGLMLPLVFKNNNVLRDLLIAVSLSLVLELSQALTRLGYFNIVDVAMNAVGCMIGCLIYLSLYRVTKSYVINYMLYGLLAIAFIFIIIFIIVVALNYKVYAPYFNFEKYPYIL